MIAVLLCLCFAGSFHFVSAQNTCIIQLQHKAGNAILEPGTIYTNQSGEAFSVRNFRYYISKIVLKNGPLQQAFPDVYFLINDADSASKHIALQTRLSAITGIEFLLGVDSLTNVSGVQTGNLDPAKGMFWTWNTGYVMAKLEGNAAAAKTPQHLYSYHVGGYKQHEQTARPVHLDLPSPTGCSNGCNLIINADILQWFGAAHLIKIAETPMCHEPGVLAMKLADNYANMFSIEAVK